MTGQAAAALRTFPKLPTPGARSLLSIVAILAALLAGLLPLASRSLAVPRQAAEAAKQSSAAAASVLAALPVRFEANAGEMDPSVLFVAHKGESTVLLRATAQLLMLPPSHATHSQTAIPATGDVVDMSLAGANVNARAQALDPAPGSVNYLLSNDRSQWHRNVPSYGSVAVHGVYPLTDLLYTGGHGDYEYSFTLAPGADPAAIAWTVTGGSARLDGGALVVTTPDGSLREQQPLAYQEVGGGRVPVAAGFVVQGNRVSFRVGAYDHARPLVIDPTVTWTYIVPDSTDHYNDGSAYPMSLAVDAANNVYIRGMSTWPEFPTTPVNASFTDGVTTNASTTFTSATANFTAADAGEAITGTGWRSPFALNTTILSVSSATTVTLSNPALYADSGVGFTLARPYRAFTDGVSKARSTTFKSASAKFTAADVGKPITASVLLPGTTIKSILSATAVTLSARAAATATNVSFSIARAFQVIKGGYAGEGYTNFVLKLDPTGTKVIYSTYLGLTTVEDTNGGANGIAVDGAGDAYITSDTQSTDYPTTANAYSRSCGADGACNAKPVTFRGYTTAGSSILESPQIYPGNVGFPLSGPNIQPGTTVIGFVGAGEFVLSKPATGTGSWQLFNTAWPSIVAVVSELDPYGSNLMYSTFLDGSNNESHGAAIAVGTGGTVYVAGNTTDFDFPITAGAFQPHCGQDGFCGAAETDGASTAGSTTYTSANGVFTSYDVGWEIAGTNIPPLTKVASLVNANTVVLSQPATGTGRGLTFAKARSARYSVFLARLNTASSGSASLAYSTYLGGNGDVNFNGDVPDSVAADATGNVYVTGHTVSTDFPTTTGGYQPSAVPGGAWHAFLTRVNTNVNTAASAPSSLVYSTYLEGSSQDIGYAVATNGSGDAWVGGSTNSADFPTTPGAYQRALAPCNPPNCANPGAGFVAELNTGASGPASLVFSTMLSGADPGPEIRALALDHASPPDVTVVGVTGWSGGFPQVNPISGGGGPASFAAELNGTGSSLLYSTYVGSGMGAGSVVLDSAGHPIFLSWYGPRTAPPGTVAGEAVWKLTP